MSNIIQTCAPLHVVMDLPPPTTLPKFLLLDFHNSLAYVSYTYSFTLTFFLKFFIILSVIMYMYTYMIKIIDIGLEFMCFVPKINLRGMEIIKKN